MEDLMPEISNILRRNVEDFLEFGAIMARAEEEKPWLEMDLTKNQWIAGEVGVPLHFANQARDAWKYLPDTEDIEGLTVGKIKLILPKLKKLEDEKAKRELLLSAKTMLYNDLRDMLGEKNTKEECEPDEWEQKTYWYCPKNGRRIYTNPKKND